MRQGRNRGLPAGAGSPSLLFNFKTYLRAIGKVLKLFKNRTERCILVHDVAHCNILENIVAA